eukprot:12910797-Prorocentrum_lima.AAC.1
MYNQSLQWDGSSESTDLLATTDIFNLNRMGQRLIAMTKVLGIMKDQLSAQDAWVVAPPIVGVSEMARIIRRSPQDEHARIVVAHEQ